MPNSESSDRVSQVAAGSGAASSIPHRSLGRALRAMRHEAGLSIETSARAIKRGAGTLHRMETGAPNVVVRDEDLAKLCKLYQRMDMLDVLKSLAAQGRTPSWLDEFPDQVEPTFDAYLQMESAATRLAIYRPDMISGLFQTPDYARALDRIYFPGDSPEDIERRVRVRQRRQARLTRELSPLTAVLVLDEATTRRVVGNNRVMSDQMRHLADLPASVEVRILPSRAGFPLGVAIGPFTILDFVADDREIAQEPPVVYVEAFTGAVYLEKSATVRRFRSAHATLRDVALDVPNTKRLLRQLAREYA
ncbi:helix-turn-helix domain-containing protein [Nocardia bovistercoris]|uniref:Helix-turn-helix domain-containing protein n=1 Tax=Nocardia bovistercoris TaxID=2785916 RepID=A0A931ICR5_9NOCA|nr:helix-turn-helix transcriptional regulator [Nocardia bovistercoris]MBH0778736.1 helix-turn-helix domain-containing protein [Nocardia bovistercoris]